MTDRTDVPDPGELLSASLDGELSASERTALEGLLAAEAGWDDELAALAVVRERVRQLPPVDPPAGFLEGLLAGGLGDDEHGDHDGGDRVAERAGGAVVSLDQARQRRTTRHRRRWIGAGAAVAAVAAVFVLVAGVVPLTDPVVPPVAAFADRHDAMASVGLEPAPPGAAPPTTGVPPTTAASAAASAADYDLMADEEIGAMEAAVAVPAQISGYRRMKGWAGPRVVHLLYSDGRATLSVYEQPGHLDWSAMPAGERRMANSEPVWVGQRGGDEILVLERDAAVITIVADLPSAELDRVIAALPPPSDAVTTRMAAATRSISRTFGF